MNVIKFNAETKTFGIHSNRVRKSVSDRYKTKYGKDSDQYKDFIERRDLINQLDSDARVDGLTEDQDSYGRNPHNRNEVGKSEINSTRNDLSNRFINDMVSKYNKDNDFIVDTLQNFRDDIRGGDANKIFEDYVLSRGNGSVTHDPSKTSKINMSGIPNSDGTRELMRVEMNINPNGGNFDAPHEVQHLYNFESGYHPGKPYNNSLNEFKDFPELSLISKNKINDYISRVAEEELSANRGRVMNTYLKVPNSNLDDAYVDSVLAQNAYNSLIGGYRPLPLRYELPKSIVKKLKES